MFWTLVKTFLFCQFLPEKCHPSRLPALSSYLPTLHCFQSTNNEWNYFQPNIIFISSSVIIYIFDICHLLFPFHRRKLIISLVLRNSCQKVLILNKRKLQVESSYTAWLGLYYEILWEDNFVSGGLTLSFSHSLTLSLSRSDIFHILIPLRLSGSQTPIYHITPGSCPVQSDRKVLSSVLLYLAFI